MPLKMVHLNQRDIQGYGKSLGKRSAHKQRAQKAGSSGESYGGDIFLGYACTVDCLTHHRHNVLLMRPGGQFRYYAAVGFVDILTGNYIGEQHTVADYGSGGVVAGRFYAEYYIAHLVSGLYVLHPRLMPKDRENRTKLAEKMQYLALSRGNFINL